MGLRGLISSIFGGGGGGSSNVPASIYDFKMKSLSGKEVDFSQFLGKNLLIVNTASKCGYTYQYKGSAKAARAIRR
jgi:glutathione peroxidase